MGQALYQDLTCFISPVLAAACGEGLNGITDAKCRQNGNRRLDVKRYTGIGFLRRKQALDGRLRYQSAETSRCFAGVTREDGGGGEQNRPDSWEILVGAQVGCGRHPPPPGRPRAGDA